MRHLFILVVMPLALMAGFTLTALPSSAAAAEPGARLVAADPTVGERCRRAGKHVYQLLDTKNDVKVAYARSVILSPGERRRTVRNVRKDMHVAASVKASSGVELGTKGLTKLLAKTEIRFSADFVVFGTYYQSQTTRVRARIHNPTNSNKEFIAFKATREYGGKYRDYFCQKHPVMDHPEWTLRSSGTWRTHEALESGTIRCGAGTPTAITKVVANRHCG